jgi:DNA-directed RNA polymerase specialized sigma24 family protein
MRLEEVARATASSVGSVKLKAHRAYEKLRAVLGRHGSGSPLRSGDDVV